MTWDWTILRSLMSQKLITATVAPAVKDDGEKVASEFKKLRSPEWKFAMAYVANGFDMGAAAAEVFKPGSKGGKDPQHSARQMGYLMLKKLDVRRYVVEIARDEHFLTSTAIERLTKLMTSAASEELQASIAWKILENAGVVKMQQQVQDHRHIHLNLPLRKDVPAGNPAPVQSTQRP